MRKTKLVLIVLFISAVWAGIVAGAQSPKIAIVDLKKLFENYWKTKEANASLKDLRADMIKEQKVWEERRKKADEEYKKALESANDQAVSAEEREKRKKLAEEKLLEIRQIEVGIEQFIRSASANLSEQERRLRDNIVKELREAINNKAKAGGYTLVLDISGETANNVPAVLYTNGENDLTDQILNELNAKAPPSVKDSTTSSDKQEDSILNQKKK